MEKTKQFEIGEEKTLLTGYLVGSQSLELSGAKDMDYVIIWDDVKGGYARATDEEGNDLFIHSTQNYDEWQKTEEASIFNLGRCWIFKGIIDDSAPFALSADEENIARLKTLIKNFIEKGNIAKVCNLVDGERRFAKCYTTLYFCLLICEHGATADGRVSLSDEELAELNDIHASKKPLSFAQEVIARINAL